MCALYSAITQVHYDFCETTGRTGPHADCSRSNTMSPLGWVAREQDDRATHTSMIRDWRHVEATMALFELKASALRNEGWLEIAPSA